MSDANSIELMPADLTTELVHVPGALLDLTVDQLRTLVIVHQEGNALRAARRLGREQSSVQKQLNTLNELARQLVGESLVIKQGRGQNLLFTPTGEQLISLAATTIDTWTTGIHSARRRLAARSPSAPPSSPFGSSARCGRTFRTSSNDERSN